MKRIRPRTTILGGAAIGLVAGVAMYATAATSTVSIPVVQPAAFSPAGVARTPEPEPAPVRPKKAPCKVSEELVKGVCVVHVEKVVVRYKPAPAQIQAMPPSQPRAAAPARNSRESEHRSSEHESEDRDHDESEGREHEGEEHEGNEHEDEEHENEGGDDD